MRLGDSMEEEVFINWAEEEVRRMFPGFMEGYWWKSAFFATPQSKDIEDKIRDISIVLDVADDPLST